MDKESKQTLLDIVKGMINSRDTTIELTEQEEIRRKALIMIYKESPKIRGYIDLCMIMYTRAVIEEKDDILVDAIAKLYSMIFDVAPRDGDTTAPQKK